MLVKINTFFLWKFDCKLFRHFLKLGQRKFHIKKWEAKKNRRGICPVTLAIGWRMVANGT